MPSKLYDPSKPTFYLDQSTLSDAFRSLLSGAAAADLLYAPLAAWLPRVGREANLCLSSAHLTETARGWDAHPSLRGLAAWLNSLPIVWLRSANDILPDEEEYWTLVAAGLSPRWKVDLFTDHPSKTLSTFGLAAFGSEPEGDDVETIVRAASKLDFEKYRRRMHRASTDIRADRDRAIERGLTEEERETTMQENFASLVRRAAISAAQRLSNRTKFGVGPSSFTQDIGERLLKVYRTNRMALPAMRVLDALSKRRAESFRARPRIDRQDTRLLSDSYDTHHACLGGAYCEVFTCDGGVAAALAPVRATMKRRAPLTRRGHPGGTPGFVRDLMSTWA